MFYHELSYRPALTSHLHSTRRHSGSNLAAVNVREKDGHYELHLMAPGRAKEDFKISVSPEKSLLIHYETPETEATEWLHQEYKLHAFKRAVKLADNMDISKIAATYENGILVITVPKAEEATQTVLEIPVH